MSELDTDQFGKASVEAGQNYQAMPDPREMQERANEQAAVERLAQQIDTEVAEPGVGVMQSYTSRPSIVSVLSTASGIVQLARKSWQHLFGQKKNSAQSRKP